MLIAAAPALARQFPGTNPGESVRLNTPNDPGFDHCEPDDEDGLATCSQPFDEEYQRFGFAPNASQLTAVYHNPLDPHVQRFSAQNTLAGRSMLGQIPGVSADRAWKYSTGDPSVQIAILDTGIRWADRSLRKRVWLNQGELPLPMNGGTTCSAYDCNGDGTFDVDDYANDPRVSPASGHDDEPAADSILDASDLIAVFSDGSDADGNGFANDIVGWDFFDDDNDPFDASSYSSASNHGTGRAQNAAEEGNDADGSIGVCPRCQIVPMRVWDTFVVDTNNFGLAALYAADNNIEVVEGAVGGLFNSSFARNAFDYAYRHGVFFSIVSSDLNTADHNIPTLYNEAMMVQGTVADVQGLGQNPPQQVIDFYNQLGLPVGTNMPIATWFRNSGTTQYGGHAHIAMPAVTGSEATGQASGAAGLLISYARQKGTPLQPNEVKQILTGTAFDIDSADTVGLGTPDPAHPGWDQHFGYGLPDLGLALERVDQGKIPPSALITSPEWYQPYNASHETQAQISGRLSARTTNYNWRLQWAPGIEPAEADFQDITVSSASAPVNGTLGTIDLAQVRAALDARLGGGATVDPTAPAKGPGDKDPNEPAFTVRVVVTDSTGNRSEDRKMLFDYRDPTEVLKKDLHSGGEASPRLFDLNGDNKLDVVQADSSGELHVYNGDGTPLASFNNGQPVQTRIYNNVHGSPSLFSVSPPRGVLRTPAIGDIDGDLEPEIVDTAGEHVFAWNADGSTVPGFPVRLDASVSTTQLRTRQNHIKRGFTASPVLGDLDDDGKLDIVTAGLDGYVYAWNGSGQTLQGFPRRLHDPTIPGAEIITTPAIGDITGDGKPDIVTPTQEFDDNPGAPPTPSMGAGGLFGNLLTNFLANVLGGSGRTYALDRHGAILPGWPTSPSGIQPDALPFVGPGVDHILANVDGDPELEAIGAVATGDTTATNGDGSNAVDYDSQPTTGEHVDKEKVLNLFENPIAANIDGLPGPEIIKGGITLNGLLNVGVLTGQNLPYNHVVQAWNAQTGASLPSWPQAVEDYQLLSSPAVADVSDAAGQEVLVGTGLYYLRDLNVAGLEGTGWPKFTGGWLFATPAIGDADGDGQLEVTTMTREGNMFVWDTPNSACGTNDEWWTSRHDEWNTGAYGTDSRPPGTPRQLTATNLGTNVRLTWTAPGDDWLCGTGTRYRIIRSPTPITRPTDGTVVGDFTAQAAAGAQETKTVPGIGSYFAVLYQDDAGNWGHLASVQSTIPYAAPESASPVSVSLAPASRECGTAANHPNGGHSLPFGTASCLPPATTGFAHMGPQATSTAQLAAVPGDFDTPADEADVSITANLTDVRSTNPGGADYNPNPSGPDLNLTERFRITDLLNGPSGDQPGTTTDFNFFTPVDCVDTPDTSVGATCSAASSADAVIPGAISEGKRSVIMIFRIRVNDSGPNGTLGDSDDRLFQQQAFYTP